MIFDEPTSALSYKEAEALFEQIDKKIKEFQLYIFHITQEIFNIADRATILRDGSVVDTLDVNSTSMKEVIKRMVGEKIAKMDRGHESSATDKISLDVKNLKTTDNKVKDVSFCVKEGEILGFYGLAG
ncbi:MAG: hypothetical protein U5N58_08515 [Actinomycetota bacterium]|nr:hypothetical protein [Actinomycetota bacterium]